MSGGGGKKVPVGDWYGLGFHAVFCHGPVDAVTEIRVGEKTAWSGSATSNSDIGINAPDLFGGEAREGGVQGTARLRMGDVTQGQDAYLQSRLGASIPAFRGVLSLIWNGWVAANNPYIKPWSVRARRIPSAWYPYRAAIGSDANPAHIIRECLTNPDWGMGCQDVDIDDASFTQAANALYDEGFGLSLLWNEEQAIEDFILSVLKHIDGTLFVHPQTGRFTLRLVRDDYDIGTLPLLDTGNVARIEEYTRPSWGETVNQVTLVYRDADTDKDVAITVQDIAAIQINGGVSATTVNYPGIANASLANRVAMRELKQLSSTLAKLTLVADRRAASLGVGDVFKLTWPPYGITQQVFRVARIGYGLHTEGTVRIEAVEDIFGLPNSVFASPPPTGWQDPLNPPAPCPAQIAYEVPYWQIVKDVVGEIPSILGDIDPTEGLAATLGARPTSDALDYHAFAYDSSSGWKDRGNGTFAPTAIISADLPQAASDITLHVTDAIDIYSVEPDDLALIDNEWLWVKSVNPATGDMTLARAVLDTVPESHAAGARIWFVHPHYIEPEYVVGETARLKLCPKTGKGELSTSQAQEIACPIRGRFIRPYPPGKVRINGAAYPRAVSGDITITWANRNRVSQTAYIVAQTDGNITPESGQTTTIRLYDSGNTLRRTYSGLTGTSQTWTLAQIIADGAGSSERVRIEIESSRTDASGTFTSLQKHVITCARTG
jgi:hypothetical protein